MLQIKGMNPWKRCLGVWAVFSIALQFTVWTCGEIHAQDETDYSSHVPAKELTRRVELAIDNARESCKTAKSDFDLNTVLRDLFRFEDELRSASSDQKLQGQADRLRSVAQKVSAWQDLLAFRNAGYDKQAQELLVKLGRFADRTETFRGVRNVIGYVNPDGSEDVTWENSPGDDEEIPIWRYKNGRRVLVTTVPPGTTSYHIPPPDDEKKPLRQSLKPSSK